VNKLFSHTRTAFSSAAYRFSISSPAPSAVKDEPKILSWCMSVIKWLRERRSSALTTLCIA
jgi:hypothetical protein